MPLTPGGSIGDTIRVQGEPGAEEQALQAFGFLDNKIVRYRAGAINPCLKEPGNPWVSKEVVDVYTDLGWLVEKRHREGQPDPKYIVLTDPNKIEPEPEAP